jgi:hypothetical protein
MAMEREGALAPDMGASSTGARKEKREQKSSIRWLASRIDHS